MEALVLHGAISSLERRGFTRAQIVRLLLVEVVRLSHGDKVLLESLVASIKKYADDRAQQARNPQK